MAAGKKIAVFPEPGAIGPVMNLVGICQGLRERGHECVFVLDPGRVYVHRRGRFPLGTVEPAEAVELLARMKEGVLALRDESPGAPSGGAPVPRVF